MRPLTISNTTLVKAPPPDAFAPIRRIGGRTGWYYANWLWQLRGFMDRLAGGVGMRRGRRHAEDLQVGDPVDFWRVEAFEPNRRLRLAAEMKLPGSAWLEFEVIPQNGVKESVLQQTAIFDPQGLPGLMYWYFLYVIHRVIFAGMMRRIVRQAEAIASAPPRETD